MAFIFSGFVFVVLIIGTATAAVWHYSEQESWPGICKTGRRQSPIALWKKAAKNKTIPTIPALNFANHDNVLKTTIVNNAHTVQIEIKDEVDSRKPKLSGGHLQGVYILDNIHFHWDAEHTIEGKRYPLEGHYVHYKKEYGNVTVASGYLDGIVVLGVMFEKRERYNKNFIDIVAAAVQISEKVNQPTKIKTGLKLKDILPKYIRSFYSYQGSLTTPSCNEAVTWVVFEYPLGIGECQFIKLSHVVDSEGKLLEKNFRSLQELNGREIMYT